MQDLLSRAGLLDRLGRGLVFDTADDAIDAFRARWRLTTRGNREPDPVTAFFAEPVSGPPVHG